MEEKGRGPRDVEKSDHIPLSETGGSRGAEVFPIVKVSAEEPPMDIPPPATVQDNTAGSSDASSDS